jgi:hypothetical protein
VPRRGCGSSTSPGSRPLRRDQPLTAAIVDEVSPSKTAKSVAAGAAALGTIASIWWFALKPWWRKRSSQS